VAVASPRWKPPGRASAKAGRRSTDATKPRSGARESWRSACRRCACAWRELRSRKQNPGRCEPAGVGLTGRRGAFRTRSKGAQVLRRAWAVWVSFMMGAIVLRAMKPWGLWGDGAAARCASRPAGGWRSAGQLARGGAVDVERGSSELEFGRGSVGRRCSDCRRSRPTCELTVSVLKPTLGSDARAGPSDRNVRRCRHCRRRLGAGTAATRSMTAVQCAELTQPTRSRHPLS
jgi:hypothetical protein